MKRSGQAEEIEKLKAQIGDLEARLQKHKKDWQAYPPAAKALAAPTIGPAT